MKIGQKIVYTNKGIYDFEEIDEADNAGLILGQTVTIADVCKKDKAVKVLESVSDVWISEEHFTFFSILKD